MWIVELYGCATLLQKFDELERWAFSNISHILLVRKPKNENAGRVLA